jgi:hypothetical protein
MTRLFQFGWRTSTPCSWMTSIGDRRHVAQTLSVAPRVPLGGDPNLKLIRSSRTLLRFFSARFRCRRRLRDLAAASHHCVREAGSRQK